MMFPRTTVARDLVRAEVYPPATRGRLVVWGLLAAYPFGGMTWQVLHHLVGFRRLGYDVWYVEDSEEPVYDSTSWLQTYDAAPNVEYLAAAMESVGLSDRWIYRFPGEGVDKCAGSGDLAALQLLYADVEAVVNVCGAQSLRPHHDSIRCLIYLETDPVEKQVRVAKGDEELTASLDRYDYRFTYGVNLGRPDCPVPVERHEWLPTRPPVIVDWWLEGPPVQMVGAMTTVANWRHSGADVEWNGRVYQWRKDIAFRAVLDLPPRSSLPLELALGAIGDEERDELRAHGWRVIPSIDVGDPAPYRDYIRGSLGEFTVAKEQYTAPRTGWFSDRSVCYLAAGRPVVTQDSGCSTWLPVGEGVLLFSTLDEAAEALSAVAMDPIKHGRAAADLAREYFAAELVLEEILARADLA